MRTTSKTTGKQVLAAVNAAAVNGTKAVWGDNYTYTAPKSNQMGSITGDIILTLGDKRDIISAHKVLPIAGTATDAAIDADFGAISKAFYGYTATNKTTEEDLLNLANAVLTNGSKLVCTSFSKLESTEDAEGKIIANFELTLNGAQRLPRFSHKIAKIAYDMPAELSVNRDEWGVLRWTNVERYKAGLPLYVMVDALQDAAEIRSAEIVTDFRKDHLRPDGSKPFTAIERSFAAPRRLGENAAIGLRTPAEIVQVWMNSKGHKANILNSMFTYIGIGATAAKQSKYWIQMFSSGGPIAQYESSTGSYTFNSVEEMECAYLICYTTEGIKAYIPFEADYMAQNGNDYTMNLHNKYITVTIIGQ